MDFSFTEEQNLLKDSFARFMQDAYSFDTYRETVASDNGYSTPIWQQMAELQWQALPFSEADGGLSYGSTELLLLAEELGRGLCVEPYLANVVLAGQMIAALGDEQQKAQLLTPLLNGEHQISLAHAELAGRYQTHYCATQAQADGDNWTLKGVKSMALNAPNAQQLLVVARTAGDVAANNGLGVFVVAADAPGVELKSCQALGGGTAAEVQLNGAKAQRLGGEAADAISDVLDLATAFTCADAYGAMQALLNKTAEYSKTRKQFGAPLGAFQVLQHRMVDMFIEVQQSQSMILMLMLKLQSDDRQERQKAVSACKAYLHKASKFVAQQAVQLHGGIGVTEELDIGHYFRRLTAFGNLLGDRRHHLQRFAEIDKAQRQARNALAAAA
ncbi:MAG: acyl-CoA dehydrogenase family protein [Oceanococcus sp.]